MSSEISFIPFRSTNDKGWAEAWQIYTTSFPLNEQWHEDDYARAFADPLFEADGIWLGDALVGILFYWHADGYCYLEHLALSPQLRGRNMGTRALQAFCDKVGKVILEIDPVVDDVSIRRERFYHHLGFHTNPYEYIHPSFHKPFSEHQLIIMSYPEPVNYLQARSFADFVREKVLRYSGHETSTLLKFPIVKRPK